MKTFIFATNIHREISIYQIKRNKPYFIGTIGSHEHSHGNISDVFNYLIDNKYIPKSYFNLSKNNWRGAGYYCPEIEDKGIKIIEIV